MIMTHKGQYIEKEYYLILKSPESAFELIFDIIIAYHIDPH